MMGSLFPRDGTQGLPDADSFGGSPVESKRTFAELRLQGQLNLQDGLATHPQLRLLLWLTYCRRANRTECTFGAGTRLATAV
jgi:hypothetical protein